MCIYKVWSALLCIIPGRVAQSVTWLATDACLTADPGVASSIPARSHTFVEIDHEIISTVILLPSADSFKKGCCQLVSYKRKYVHKLLVNRLFKPAQEKVWLGELDRPAMTIAVDLGRKATKPTNQQQGLDRLHISQKVWLLVVLKDILNDHGALCVWVGVMFVPACRLCFQNLKLS